MDIQKGVVISRTNLIDSKREITIPWKGVSLVVFFTLALWAGMFFYNNSVKKKISSLQNSVNEIKQGRDYSKIASVADMEDRLNSINSILGQRINWEKMLQKMEENTLPGVTFSNMDAKIVSKNSQIIPQNNVDAGAENGKCEISLKGNTVGLNTLAQQVLAFEGSKEIAGEFFADEVTIEKIDMKKTEAGEMDKGGALDFTIKTNVNPNIIKNSIK